MRKGVTLGQLSHNGFPGKDGSVLTVTEVPVEEEAFELVIEDF